MRSAKAQVAYEFILLFFFLTGLFTFWFIITAEAQERVRDEQQQMHLEDLGLSLQDELYTALQMPDGFNRTITLPPNINGEPYNVTVKDNNGDFLLLLEMTGRWAEYASPPLTVNEQPRKLPEENTITKNAGQLRLN